MAELIDTCEKCFSEIEEKLPELAQQIVAICGSTKGSAVEKSIASMSETEGEMLDAKYRLYNKMLYIADLAFDYREYISGNFF